MKPKCSDDRKKDVIGGFLHTRLLFQKGGDAGTAIMKQPLYYQRVTASIRSVQILYENKTSLKTSC